MPSRLWDFLSHFSSGLFLHQESENQSWNSRVCLQDELPSLNRLSDDVLVDNVFSYLAVEDILILRRVSKLYYNLTHQGIVWKRFLKRIGPIAPELPPSSRYSPCRLTSFEAERLVIRAITLHFNWTCPWPAPVSRVCPDGHRHIHSMVVLPGGKYMVASASNKAETHFSLVVYALDHRTDFLLPLAETPVKQRVHNLKAKYMNIDGVPSIVIAYVRWKVSSRVKDLDIDLSKYNPIRDNPRFKIDLPAPIQYVCPCLQISLDALDEVADPRRVPSSREFLLFAASQPPPFRLLSVVRSTSTLGAIDLALIAGVPNLAVVKGSETIIFRELTGRCFTSTLNCARNEPFSLHNNIICNFRILPHQNQVLVARSVQVNPEPLFPPLGAPLIGFATLALFPIPSPGDNETPSYSSDDVVTYHADDIEGVQISEPSDRAALRGTTSTEDPVYPPISVFFRRQSRKRLGHIVIDPIPTASRQPQGPRYTLQSVTNITTIHLQPPKTADYLAFVLPGTQRSLIYTTPPNCLSDTPAINGFYSHFYDPEFKAEYSSRQREMLRSITRRPLLVRSYVTAKIHHCMPVFHDTHHAIKAIAWDEEVGRILYVRPNDSHIYIINLSMAPSQREDGQRWPVPLANEQLLES